MKKVNIVATLKFKRHLHLGIKNINNKMKQIQIIFKTKHLDGIYQKKITLMKNSKQKIHYKIISRYLCSI